MEQTQILPDLFRTEYSKIVAVLCKNFGMQHIELAEDIAGETFLLASSTWGLKGLPQNPTAWLYTVAKNKAIDYLKRKTNFKNKIEPELFRLSETIDTIEINPSGAYIKDSQLQMMFAICDPVIPVESQIGLSLNILCGFGVEEIAEAFLTNRDTIYKRLQRAKEKLRTENIKIELPPKAEIVVRINTVLTTLYLLFNEGYYSSSQNTTLRKDLCIEAMRLTLLLIENPVTNSPSANALLALMCFHASRFDARVNSAGEIVLYEHQDENLWNKELIQRGEYYLNFSSGGKAVSKYHLEAAIAYWHTLKQDTTEKWENILQIYNKLLQIEYSPIAALNRTYALAKANGIEAAIIEAEKLKLDGNQQYHVLLGHLYRNINKSVAKQHLQVAKTLTKRTLDKKYLDDLIVKLENQS